MALGLTQLLVGALYGVKPLEPLALAGSAAILLAATLAAWRSRLARWPHRSGHRPAP